MPVYEFECGECNAQFSLLLGAVEHGTGFCPSCYSTEIRRLVSRFSRGRAETDRISEAASKLAMATDQDTGKALAEVGKAYDEDLSTTMSAMYEEDQGGA